MDPGLCTSRCVIGSAANHLLDDQIMVGEKPAARCEGCEFVVDGWSNSVPVGSGGCQEGFEAIALSQGTMSLNGPREANLKEVVTRSEGMSQTNCDESS